MLIGVPPNRSAATAATWSSKQFIAAGDAVEATSSARLVMIDQRDALLRLEALTSKVRPIINFEVTGKTTMADSDLRDKCLCQSCSVHAHFCQHDQAFRAQAVADRSAALADNGGVMSAFKAENAQRPSRHRMHRSTSNRPHCSVMAPELRPDFGLKTVLDVSMAE